MINLSGHLLKNTEIHYFIFFLLVLMSFSIIILVIYLKINFKTLNNNLKYREELLNTLCTNEDNIYVVYDNINKKYEYISPNFEKNLGYDSSILMKYQMLDSIITDDNSKLFDMITFKKITSYQELELEYHHPDTQQIFRLILRIYPVFINNRITRYIAYIVNVTKEYETQAAILSALSEMKKANEAKKEFLSHMSHELKTPINAIIGMAQIVSMSPDDFDKIADCIDKIKYASENLLLMIDNILDTAKIDSNKLLLNYEPFELSKAIFSLSSLMEDQAKIKGLDYSFSYHQIEHDQLIGDSLRLSQILGNCLYNSIKFTPAGGKVIMEVSELRCIDQKCFYRFIITDTGKGMQKEFINHMFDPFEQEDQTISSKYGGSGLGMSITKKLLDLMDGEICVESQLGKGTIITINIGFDLEPGAQNKLAEEKYNLAEEKDNLLESDNYNTTSRILVVEDNEINLEIVSEFLHYLKIDFDMIMSGYEALKLFEASSAGYYDTVLMDVHIPDMDGYELSRSLRASKHPDAKTIRIIAMTADHFIEEQNISQFGMNGYITKPLDIEKLNTMLRTIHYDLPMS